MSGRLQIRSWESEHGKRYATEVIVNNIEILEWKKDIQKQAENYFDNVPNVEISEDSLPF